MGIDEPTGRGWERLRRLDALWGDNESSNESIQFIGKSISIPDSESLELVEEGHVCSEDVRMDEPSLCEEKSDKAELGGGEEHEVGLAKTTLKWAPSTGVRSSPSRTSPSLEETSSASGKMTALRLARFVFTGDLKSDRLRGGGGGVSGTDESSTLSSGRVPNPGVA